MSISGITMIHLITLQAQICSPLFVYFPCNGLATRPECIPLLTPMAARIGSSLYLCRFNLQP